MRYNFCQIFIILLFVFILSPWANSLEIGYLQIKCSPEIIIGFDGEIQGVSNAQLEGFLINAIPVGEHRLQAIKPGFVTFDTTVIIGLNEVLILPVTLVVDPVQQDTMPGPNQFVPMDVFPAMYKHCQPEYPVVSKVNNQEGIVWVKVLITKEGIVYKAIVAKTCGFPLLDKAAVKAAYGNKWRPAKFDGSPVTGWVTYKVEFALKE